MPDQQKLDVVYTLGNGSKHGDDLELRYSLRSIASQPWLNRIFLIGHKPSWIKNIIHIPLTDYHPSRVKDKNIILKVLRATAVPSITENFVVWSDDIYALRTLTIENFGPYIEYPSQYDEVKFIPIQHITSSWKQRLVQTVEFCKKNNYPDFTPDFHIPYIVPKSLYQEVMFEIPWHYNNGLLTHTFMNVLVPRGQYPSPKHNPNAIVRIKEQLTHKAIANVTSNKLFLNHNNTGLNKDMQFFLNEKFPTQSKYE